MDHYEKITQYDLYHPDDLYGFFGVGVQEISDSDDVRALAVMDSRIIDSATDFGWLFEIESGSDYDYELTAENAPFKYSCVDSHNNMDGDYGYSKYGVPSSTAYKYITARISLSEKPVRARFYVKLENDTDYVYANEIQCDVPTIASDANMDMITDNLTFDATKRSLFAGHSLSLNGSIGVNFFLDITSNEAASTTVEFKWFDKELNDVPVTYDDDTGYYKASCPVAVAEMTYDVTATVTINNEAQEETNTYSAKRYADYILTDDFKNKYRGTGAKSYENLKTLVEAMLDYGTRAQVRFDRNTRDLANDGNYYFDGDVTIESTASDMSAGLEAYGLQYDYSTVVFLSKTLLRHYYTVTNQETFDRYKDSVTFDGAPAEAKEKGDRIYFEKENISAKDLDTQYELVIGDNSYRYSAMDYVKLLIASDLGEASVELGKATCRYNQAANVYFA